MLWTTWIGAGIWFVVCGSGGLILGRALWVREWRRIVRERGRRPQAPSPRSIGPDETDLRSPEGDRDRPEYSGRRSL